MNRQPLAVRRPIVTSWERKKLNDRQWTREMLLGFVFTVIMAIIGALTHSLPGQ